jgi:hypothetical protein
MVSPRTKYYLHTPPPSQQFSFSKILILRQSFNESSVDRFGYALILLMISFYFLLMPIVYHILYYAFSQDLFKTGQISNQHEKVNS